MGGDQQEEAVVPQVVDAGRTREPAAGSGPAGLGDAVQGDQLSIHGRHVLAVGDAAGDVEVVPAGDVADELGTGCAFSRVADIKAHEVESYLESLRSEGLSKQTSNHYLRAVKQFCRWLKRTKRMDENPLADIPMLNVQTDRRHDRRPLLIEEFILLVAAAEAGPPIEGISGIDRATMYILSAWTGYRKGEIGSLTRGSFDLTSDPPTVTVQAIYSKRKRTDTQVLHPDVVTRLTEWFAQNETAPAQILFPVSGKVPGGIERKTAKMMRRDLAAARAAWLKEAKTDEERATREKSDFLRYKDTQGRYADFHANRHTFITNLGRAGVNPKTAQTLARHSDIRLTMNIYSHTDLLEKTEAVRRLPRLWECFSSTIRHIAKN